MVNRGPPEAGGPPCLASLVNATVKTSESRGIVAGDTMERPMRPGPPRSEGRGMGRKPEKAPWKNAVLAASSGSVHCKNSSSSPPLDVCLHLGCYGPRLCLSHMEGLFDEAKTSR